MSSLLKNIFDTFIRTLSRPIIQWILTNKKNDLVNDLGYIGKYFAYIGNKWNYITVKIQRKVLKISNLSEIKDLPKNVAVEKGCELSAEILIYIILLILPILSIKKSFNNQYIKETKENELINSMITEISQIEQENLRLEKQLEKYTEDYKNLINKRLDKNSKL